MMPLQNTMTKIDIPIVMHTDDTINCFADLHASSFFPAPRNWEVTTAPPVASAASTLMIRLLNISIRDTPETAASPAEEIMTDAHAEEIGGVIHCYSYTKETAKVFLDMGFYFGIGGVLTFKNAKKLKEAVEYIPMDRIVLETDCPYLAPEPNRGKRNSSLNIPYVIAAMAQIKGITEEEVRKAAWDNSLKLYRMDK